MTFIGLDVATSLVIWLHTLVAPDGFRFAYCVQSPFSLTQISRTRLMLPAPTEKANLNVSSSLSQSARLIQYG